MVLYISHLTGLNIECKCNPTVRVITKPRICSPFKDIVPIRCSYRVKTKLSTENTTENKNKQNQKLTWVAKILGFAPPALVPRGDQSERHDNMLLLPIENFNKSNNRFYLSLKKHKNSIWKSYSNTILVNQRGELIRVWKHTRSGRDNVIAGHRYGIRVPAQNGNWEKWKRISV